MLLVFQKYNVLYPTSIKQVGDAGPILDAMAVMLENISTITVIARTTIAAVYRTAQIIAAMPNLSYQNKVGKINFFFNCLFYTRLYPDNVFSSGIS